MKNEMRYQLGIRIQYSIKENLIRIRALKKKTLFLIQLFVIISLYLWSMNIERKFRFWIRMVRPDPDGETGSGSGAQQYNGCHMGECSGFDTRTKTFLPVIDRELKIKVERLLIIIYKKKNFFLYIKCHFYAS